MSELVISRLSGRIAATVEASLDLLLSGEVDEQLVAALYEHQVIVFPELNPSPDQHLQLAEIFGPTAPFQGQNVPHPDNDHITVFDSEGGYKADQWHTDATYLEEVPLGAALCMRKRPSVGGDTVFTNCYAAYDSLSGGMKKLIDNRRSYHEIVAGSGTEQPVVITHPVTGKPVLFVNRIFSRSITNLPPNESQVILPFLLDHVTRPDFTYRHQWNEGDVVIWDNWSTQHYALFDFDEQRIVHRVSIDGRRLEPFCLPTPDHL